MGEVGYKKPPKHGQIKKGEVRNPKGAGAHIPAKVNLLTQKEVQEIGSAILKHDLEGLKEIIDTRETSGRSVIMIWIASIAYRAIIKGEVGALETLLNRFVGKVPDKIAYTDADGEDSKITIELVDAEKK